MCAHPELAAIKYDQGMNGVVVSRNVRVIEVLGSIPGSCQAFATRLLDLGRSCLVDLLLVRPTFSLLFVYLRCLAMASVYRDACWHNALPEVWMLRQMRRSPTRATACRTKAHIRRRTATMIGVRYEVLDFGLARKQYLPSRPEYSGVHLSHRCLAPVLSLPSLGTASSH
jgi:hypothetical protein